MRKSIEVAAKMFAMTTLCLMSLGVAGCAGNAAETTDLTGMWSGSFMTDNAVASMGTLTFDLTENEGTHAVSGTVTGMASGVALSGTFTGSVTDGKLNGSVAVTAPIMTMLAFPNATISGDTITGNINISDPLKASGSFTLKRQ
jgi:hypothetical protein